MNPDDRNRECRGAWKAGYEAGFREGREALSREGWKNVLSSCDVQEGDIVKALIPTVMGQWKGIGRVLVVDRGGVVVEKLTPPDVGEEADFAFGEVMVKRPLAVGE